jgi:hypothetical protein
MDFDLCTIAAYTGHLSILKEQCKINPEILFYRRAIIGSPFIAAVSGGQLPVIDYLLMEVEKRVTGNARTYWVKMMNCAISLGQRPVVDHLLESPWAPDFELGLTEFHPIMPECCEGIPDPEILKLLIDITERSPPSHNIIDTGYIERLLYRNIWSGMHETVSCLLDIGRRRHILWIGADIPITDLRSEESVNFSIDPTLEGWSVKPLDVAFNRIGVFTYCTRCNGLPYHGLDMEPVVRVLLEHGATPDGFEKVKRAARLGRVGTVRALIEHGAPVNVLPNYTNAWHNNHLTLPLAYAVMLEHMTMVHLLLANGTSFQQLAAITNSQFISRQQPTRNALSDLVQAAKEEGLASMLMLMKNHGVDID